MNKPIEVKMVSWFDDHFYKVVYAGPNGEAITDYFPSVTTKLGAIAKPYLARWRGDVGNREADFRMKEGADKGTREHWGLQALVTGGVVLYQPKNKPSYTREEVEQLMKENDNKVVIFHEQDEMYDMTKIQRFCEIVNPEFLQSEFIVIDIENRDAGTTDAIWGIKAGSYLVNGSKPLVLPEGKYIVDLKSGSVVGDEALMQIASYAKMADKMEQGPIVGGLILHTQGKNRSGIEGLNVIYLTKEEIDEEYHDYRLISEIWTKKFGSMKPTVRDLPTLIQLKK